MTTIQLTMPDWFANAMVVMFVIWLVVSIISTMCWIILILTKRELEKTTAELNELQRE